MDKMNSSVTLKNTVGKWLKEASSLWVLSHDSHKQPQMASQEFHSTGLGISAGATSPGRHMKPEETHDSVYRPLDEMHHVQRGVLQALGVSCLCYKVGL